MLTFFHVNSCLDTDRRDDLPPAVRSLKSLLFLFPHCETNRDFFLTFLFNALKFSEHVPSSSKVYDAMTVHPWRTWTPFFLAENWNPQPGTPAQLCTTLKTFIGSTDSNGQNNVAKMFLLLWLLKKSGEYSVAFLFFTECLLLFTCLVYWKKYSTLPKKKKSCRNCSVSIYQINSSGLFCMCGRSDGNSADMWSPISL